MKSMKLKALAIAIVGLAAGNAMAVCPAAGALDTANGGAWDAKITGTTPAAPGFAAVDPNGGLDGSECKMSSVINAGANALTVAGVRDDIGQSESTYRARFMIDINNIGSVNALGGFDGVQIFTVNAQNSAPAVNPTQQILKLAISGPRNLTIIAACDNGGSNKCTTSTPLVDGVNSIEVEVKVGGVGTGAVNVWVNSNTAATPTKRLTTDFPNFDNTAWVGAFRVILGLSNPTKGYVAGGGNQAGQIVFFDAFDSRRQTFIGG